MLRAASFAMLILDVAANAHVADSQMQTLLTLPNAEHAGKHRHVCLQA